MHNPKITNPTPITMDQGDSIDSSLINIAVNAVNTNVKQFTIGVVIPRGSVESK